MNKSLRTLIVDDEPIARQVLREELELMPEVEIVGEADSGPAALEGIVKYRPDLVFLDLQMPVMGGFDVVRNLDKTARPPIIIIVTAYDKFALEAFEAGAIDYLLKPVRHERLTHAVERAARLTGSEAVEKLAQLQDIAGRPVRRIVGRIGEELFLLSTDEIYAFQADGDIVWIVTARRKYQASQTLKTLDERLRAAGFRRIHRNAMVNVAHVRKMSARSSQRWLITLNNDQEFIASKRQARGVRQLLHW